jgi:cytochrome c oxidase cbb3-type subunit III
MSARVARVAWLVLSLASCRREERRFSEPESLVARRDRAASAPSPELVAAFVDNAWSVSEGQVLYGWYNCAGCHSLAGGGGMGPPLRDAAWIYGGSPEAIHRSIVEGRPNGMPAFGSRLPDYQVWQLVAYVLSFSGRLRQDVAPGRPETIALGEPPAMTDAKQPGPTRKETRP